MEELWGALGDPKINIFPHGFFETVLGHTFFVFWSLLAPLGDPLDPNLDQKSSKMGSKTVFFDDPASNFYF